MEKQLIRVQEKFQLLKKLDSNCILFGADTHKYQFRKKLTLQQVAAFETKHRIQLPLDYVAFLTQFGNGGAGPFYGMAPLDKTLFQDLDDPDKKFLNQPAKPFPHVAPWNVAEKLAVLQDQLDELDADADEDFEETLWSEKWGLTSGEEHNYGVLNVCNYGCGVSFFLVVNGAEKGNMWTDHRAYDLGIYPTNEDEFGNTIRISFLDWYEQWLDQSLDEIKQQH